MATGEYLPPVVSRLTMDMGDFESAIAKAKALMKSLNGDATIKVGSELNKGQLAGVLANASTIVDSFNGANIRIGSEVDMSSLMRSIAEIKAATSAVSATAGAAAGGAAGAAGGALLGGMFGGWLTANALHWIIAGGAEILAVTVPALVALGAAAAVAAPAVQNVAQHMKAVQIATSAAGDMFNTTAGQMVGLTHSLQAAQDAASPSVYGALGSAVITVNEHFGNLAQTGLQVTQVFQTFAAKVATDFAPGGSMGSTVDALLSHMTTDLTQIGQLFGNLGHSLLTFAAQMPGLAEILLGSFAGIAGALSNVLQFVGKFQVAGASLITVFMGFEEFNRWGGLLATTLTKLGIAQASLVGGPFSFARMGSVIQGLLSIFPTLLSYVARFAATVGAGGMAKGLTGMAEGLAGAIEQLSPFQAGLIAVAAIGLGIFIDKLVTARSAAQQFTDSLQQAALSASNVQSFQQITQNIGQLQAQIAQATQQVTQNAASLGTLTTALNPSVAASDRFNSSVRTQNYILQQSQQAAATYNAGLQQQQQDLNNVTQGAIYLAATYKTNLVGALALADLANVKLANGILGSGQAAQIARMQIASLVQGYEAMGQPLTAVGSDMTALAIQSGLANTQVSKLNQAWDQFMQNLTGGTSGLANFVQSLQNMGSVAASTTNNLANGTGKISLSVSQFADSLKTFTGNGAQAWQNFDQVVGSTAPQLIDWLRTAGAEGALSGGQFTQAVLGMVSSLTGFASASPTAQAELLGLVQQVDPNIQTWGQLTTRIKDTGASLKNTQDAVQQATAKMGDMAQVAQNLGTVMQNALLTSLSQAKIQASGAGAAMQTYEQDIMNAGTSASKTAGDRAALISDLEKLGYSAKQAAQLVQLVANNINNLHDKTVTITVNTVARGTAAGSGGGTRIVNGGYASGTPAAPSGWAWVGEAGPELVKFRGGEQVLPNQVSRGFAQGAYTGGDIHVHVSLDGRQIANAVASRAVQSQRRTGHNGMQRRTR